LPKLAPYPVNQNSIKKKKEKKKEKKKLGVTELALELLAVRARIKGVFNR